MLEQGVISLTESGYHGSGLKSLLMAAGIPKGSFYYYFQSKDHFAAAVIRHYIRPFLEQLSTALAADPPQPGAVIIEHYFEGLIDAARASGFRGGCLLGNLMGELGEETGPLARKALQDALSDYVAVIERVITQGLEDGSMASAQSPRDLAERLVDHWQGAQLRAKLEGSERPLRLCLRAVGLDGRDPGTPSTLRSSRPIV